MNVKNLLYLTTGFKPTGTYKRASFIDIEIELCGKNIKIPMGRDAMGVGWIVLKEPFPDGNPKITRMKPFDTNDDQILMGWLPYQIALGSRKARYSAIKNLIQCCINEIGSHSKIICIPRLAVFKESVGLHYQWEIIDGTDPGMVAEHIGDCDRLLTDDILDRGFLKPPMRILD
jgi:hypothetical protein